MLLDQHLKECDGSGKACNVRWLKNCSNVSLCDRDRFSLSTKDLKLIYGNAAKQLEIGEHLARAGDH
jgi:hypothetical protein